MSRELLLITVGGIASLTSLIVEALKKLQPDLNNYNVNASVTSVILTVLSAFGYAIMYDVVIDARYILFFIYVAIGSWLSSMLGFDKVKQTLIQLGIRNGE